MSSAIAANTLVAVPVSAMRDLVIPLNVTFLIMLQFVFDNYLAFALAFAMIVVVFGAFFALWVDQVWHPLVNRLWFRMKNDGRLLNLDYTLFNYLVTRTIRLRTVTASGRVPDGPDTRYLVHVSIGYGEWLWIGQGKFTEACRVQWAAEAGVIGWLADYRNRNATHIVSNWNTWGKVK